MNFPPTTNPTSPSPLAISVNNTVVIVYFPNDRFLAAPASFFFNSVNKNNNRKYEIGKRIGEIRPLPARASDEVVTALTRLR